MPDVGIAVGVAWTVFKGLNDMVSVTTVKSDLFPVLAAQMDEVLTTLSEIELSAARQALRNADMSNNPEAEVRGAIQHLISAYEALNRVSARKRYFLFLQVGEDDTPVYRAWDKRHAISGILAASYARLGEHALALHYAEKLASDFSWYYGRAFSNYLGREYVDSLNATEREVQRLLLQLGYNDYTPKQRVWEPPEDNDDDGGSSIDFDLFPYG